jgi:hypothetical protein
VQEPFPQFQAWPLTKASALWFSIRAGTAVCQICTRILHAFFASFWPLATTALVLLQLFPPPPSSHTAALAAIQAGADRITPDLEVGLLRAYYGSPGSGLEDEALVAINTGEQSGDRIVMLRAPGESGALAVGGAGED